MFHGGKYLDNRRRQVSILLLVIVLGISIENIFTYTRNQKEIFTYERNQKEIFTYASPENIFPSIPELQSTGNDPLLEDGPDNIDTPLTRIQVAEDYYSKYAFHRYLGANRYHFSTKIGMENIYDGEKFVPFIWFENNKTVKYQDFSLQFFDWYTVYSNTTHTLIDDLRWQVEYWTTQAGGRWNSLDLYNHQFFPVEYVGSNIKITQSYNDTLNVMNISYICGNLGVKVEINYYSGEERVIRFAWALSGINARALKEYSNRIFLLDTITVSLNDTHPNKLITYDWTVSTKKLNVYIENYSVTLGSQVTIDPTFSGKQETDSMDFYQVWDGGAITVDDSTEMRYGRHNAAINDTAFITFDTSITDELDTISNAVLTFYFDTIGEADAGDYMKAVLYNKSDADHYWNESEAQGDDATAWAQTGFHTNGSFFSAYGASANTSIACTPTIQAWANYHDNDPTGFTVIPIKLEVGDGWETGSGYTSFMESSHATQSFRPTLTFDYTIEAGGGNNAPNNPTLHSDSGNTFAGKWFNVITNHTDDDGGADIEDMYLQHYYSGYNVTISCPQDTASGSVTIVVGSGYLEGTPTYSHSAVTNGYSVTWNITFDWDFIDDTAYTIYGETEDDEPSSSGWVSLDTNNLFENDLEATTDFMVTIDGTAEYGGADGVLDDNDWFRGGVQVTANGTVEYEGSSQTFDTSYAAAIDVELYYDGAGTGQIDASISSGVFSSITYTPTSAAGLDTTAYFDVQINDIPTGGSDVTAAGIEITSKRDNQNPSVSVSPDSDSASIGLAPNTNYDDDSTIDFTASGGSDGAGSGLPSACYSWNYTSWVSSTTKQFSGQSDGNKTTFLDIRDNVGNNGTRQQAWVVIDTTTPSGYILTWDRVNGTYACVHNSSGFYFDDGQNNYTIIYVNDTGTIGNSAFWKIRWDANSVLETSADDSSGLPDNKNFNYFNDDNGTLVILIINNAGNYQNISTVCYDTYDSGEEPDVVGDPINRINPPFNWIPYVNRFIQDHLTQLFILFALSLICFISFLTFRRFI
jgi:hypothetical protein